MIAGYQAEKLRSKVTEKIRKYGYAADIIFVDWYYLRICSKMMIVDCLKFQLK